MSKHLKVTIRDSDSAKLSATEIDIVKQEILERVEIHLNKQLKNLSFGDTVDFHYHVTIRE